MDTNYYHKIILNFYSMPPENIYFSTSQRLFEKFLSFPAHQPPPPKYGWIAGWMDEKI